MLPLISKYKLYLYLFFLIFLSSIFNFKFFENYQDKFSLKNIHINGVSYKEKINIEEELYKLKNTNIFKINEDKVLKKLAKFNFIEDIYVKKIIPSSININLSKTSILGKTFVSGEEFYIGKNGKLINSNQIFENNKTPTVFGEFDVKEFLNLCKNETIELIAVMESAIDSVEKKVVAVDVVDGWSQSKAEVGIAAAKYALNIAKEALADHNLPSVERAIARIEASLIEANPANAMNEENSGLVIDKSLESIRFDEALVVNPTDDELIPLVDLTEAE